MLKKGKWGVLGMVLLLSLFLIAGCAKEQSPEESQSSGDPSGITDETTQEPILLAQNGEPEFRILYPRNGGAYEEAAAQTLKSAYAGFAGKSPKIYSDNYEYDENAKEIYIGKVNRLESEQALSGIGYGDFIIKKVGNKIVVNAYNSTALKDGVNTLIKMMRAASTDTQVLLPSDITTQTEVFSMLNQIPKIADKVPHTYCVRENMSYTLAAETSDITTYEGYLKTLEQTGYTQYTTNKIADNLFATYLNEKHILNISFFPAKKTMHVSVEDKSGISLPDVEKSTYEAVTEPQMMLLGVSEATYDNGMSIFFRLSDGRFVVYDGGGADGAKDVKNLCTQLRKSADEAGVRDIVIAAWIITHAHGDHVTAYNTFFRSEYSGQIKVENLIISPTSYDYGDAAAEGLASEALAISETKVKSPKTKIIFAHAGQSFTFADATIEILFTLDAIMPYDFTSTKADMYNGASIISKVHISGKTVLMAGDAYMDTMDFIADVYGSYLKSDYLQVPHHGVQGGTIKAYNLIRPEYLVWPAGPKVFGMVTKPNYAGYAANNHLLQTMGLSDKMFLAGSFGTVTEIPGI